MHFIITGFGWRRYRGPLALVLLALIGSIACDKVPLLAPRQSTITLSSASLVVQANGVTEIRATVIEESGTPVHNGTTVMFTTTLGTLAPPESRTENGVAKVQLLANGQSGRASVKAISGGAVVRSPGVDARRSGGEPNQPHRESDNGSLDGRNLHDQRGCF